MASKPPSQPQAAVRFSRVMPRRWAIALGVSASIGLGIFTLLGVFAQLANRQTLGVPFLLMALTAIPVVLTYAERATVTPGSGGVYNLARPSGLVWLIFANGWLLVGGYAVLMALLGWGVALQVNLLLAHFFDLRLDHLWLAVAVIGITALNSILGTKWAWQTRSRYILLGSGFIAGFAFLSWITATPPAVTVDFSRGSSAIFQLAAIMFSSLWGIHFILNARDEIQRPTRTLPQAMMTVVLLTAGVGTLAGAAIAKYSVVPATMTPLLEIHPVDGSAFWGLMVILYSAAGLILTSIALNQSLVNALQTINEMVRDGFFSTEIQSVSEKYQVPVLALVPFALFSMVLISLFPVAMLAGLAAIAFLWTTVLVHLPDAFRARPNLPKKRFPKLPFHPLFPWLTAIIGLFFPLYLGTLGMAYMGLWLVLGVLVYLFTARRGGMAVHRRGVTIGDTPTGEIATQSTTIVLVAVSNPATAPHLLHAGAQIARARNGTVLALKIVSLAEQIPTDIKRKRAETEWQALALLANATNVPGVKIRPLVRLAPSPVAGILEATAEERANILLVGWPGHQTAEDVPAGAVIDPLLKRTRCEVVVLRGHLPETVDRIRVPTAGGPHAAVGLALGRDLSALQPHPSQIIVEHITEQTPSPEGEQAAAAVLKATLTTAQNGHAVQSRQIPAATVAAGILSDTRPTDVLFIGASNQGFLEQAILGGLAAEIATQVTTPAATLLTRGKQLEGRQRWLRQGVEYFVDALPSLTDERRTNVYAMMKESAQPSVDFFVLITLAAVIASLGLLQNSAAVIIGAMLVAPLMSPILAMAMSMVHGNLQLLRVAAEATTKGIVLAIVVGAVVTFVSPLQTATNEILARTQPNLLDLLVALASGAAAGYAISRKEVAAALPGVAIAAALVPPLCVVGYGIGTAQLSVAGGSLLLFITNLIAIVLSAAGTFLALGFHPTRTDRRDLMRGLRVTFISLGIVTAILLVTTIATVSNLNRQVKIDAIFENKIVARSSYVMEKTITRKNGQLVISAIIVDILGNQLTPTQITQIEDELTDIAGGPVTIDAIVIPGYITNFEEQAMRQRLESLFRLQIEQLDGQLDWVNVTGNSDAGFKINARLIMPDNSVTSTKIEAIQQTLGEVIDSPITIETTVLAGQKILVEPTPTPEP